MNKLFRGEPADSEGESVFSYVISSHGRRRVPSRGSVCLPVVFFSSLHILFPLPGLVIVRLWLLATVDSLTSFVFGLPGSYHPRNSLVSSDSGPNFGNWLICSHVSGMWTAEFTEAVDTLIRDTSISDDALHARARQCLDLLTESNPGQLGGPLWARRIQTVIPQIPAFSTFRLFNALYTTADKLRLVAGKRYVSATICACRDRTIPGAVSPDGQWTNLVQALDDVASTWAAFVLWPCESTFRYLPSANTHLIFLQSTPTVRTSIGPLWKSFRRPGISNSAVGKSR